MHPGLWLDPCMAQNGHGDARQPHQAYPRIKHHTRRLELTHIGTMTSQTCSETPTIRWYGSVTHVKAAELRHVR